MDKLSGGLSAQQTDVVRRVMDGCVRRDGCAIRTRFTNSARKTSHVADDKVVAHPIGRRSPSERIQLRNLIRGAEFAAKQYYAHNARHRRVPLYGIFRGTARREAYSSRDSCSIAPTEGHQGSTCWRYCSRYGFPTDACLTVPTAEL